MQQRFGVLERDGPDTDRDPVKVSWKGVILGQILASEIWAHLCIEYRLDLVVRRIGTLQATNVQRLPA